MPVEILLLLFSTVFKEVDRKNEYNDMEKGIQDFTIVIERLVDGKFFQFDYAESDQCELDEGGLNDFPKTVYEVFAEVITTTIYK